MPKIKSTSINKVKHGDIQKIHDNKLDYKINMIIIFSISFALFSFQVILTRIFSALFSYHYTFLSISVALAGTVIGSIIAYKIVCIKKISQYLSEQLSTVITLIAVAILFSVLMIFSIPVTLNVYAYVLFILPVYIFGGFVISFLFRSESSFPQRLYFSDMAGAGAGSILSILLMNQIGIISSIIVLILITFSSSALLIFHRKFYIPIFSFIILILIFIGSARFIEIENNFKAFLSSSENKAIYRYKKNKNDIQVAFTKWDAFSRTDVIEMKDFIKFKIMTIDGTSHSRLLNFNGNIKSMENKVTDTPYYVYSMNKSEKVLLIGTGGGSEIIYPLLNGCENISAVEINKAAITAVKYFNKYSGNIYNRKEVKVFNDDGRKFIHKSNDKFDVIFFSLVSTDIATQTGYMLAEDFLYTTEAIGDYINHLTDDGRLAIIVQEEQEMNRLIATICKVFQKKGNKIKDILDRFVIINLAYSSVVPEMYSKNIFQPMIIVKKNPLTKNEAQLLIDNYSTHKERLLYVPYFAESKLLKSFSYDEQEIDNFIKNYHINISPVSDDKPYFRIFENELPFDLMIVFALLIVFFMGAFIFLGITKIGIKESFYFSGVGLGFLMIEIPVISKLNLYLGHPVLGFSISIFFLLISSGVGSLVCNKIKFLKNRSFYFPLLAIIISGIIFLTIFPGILYKSMNLLLYQKIIISGFFIIPLGFFMGMPFPYALLNYKTAKKMNSIPAIWAIVGISSVLGSLSSVCISIFAGYSIVMWIGIALYLIIFIGLNPEKIFR